MWNKGGGGHNFNFNFLRACTVQYLVKITSLLLQIFRFIYCMRQHLFYSHVLFVVVFYHLLKCPRILNKMKHSFRRALNIFPFLSSYQRITRFYTCVFIIQKMHHCHLPRKLED